MLLDLVYLLALAALSPWLVWRAFATGRYRRELVAKLLGWVSVHNPTRTRVAWFHAVSVGEVNLLGTLVPQFRKRHPDWLVVVSSTTDTGLAEARKRFTELDVIAWPFDFTWAVATALDTVNPSLVVLTESELWPNFLAAANARNVPVVVVNARLSPRSFRRLKRVAGLARRMLFRRVTRFAVQEAEYTDRLQQLGVPPAKLVTTGSIKYDGAAGERDTPKTRALGHAIGLGESPPTGSPCNPLLSEKGEVLPSSSSPAARTHQKSHSSSTPSRACALASRLCDSSSFRATRTALKKSPVWSKRLNCRSCAGAESQPRYPRCPRWWCSTR